MLSVAVVIKFYNILPAFFLTVWRALVCVRAYLSHVLARTSRLPSFRPSRHHPLSWPLVESRSKKF